MDIVKSLIKSPTAFIIIILLLLLVLLFSIRATKAKKIMLDDDFGNKKSTAVELVITDSDLG